MQLAKGEIVGNRPKNAAASAVPNGTSLELDVGTGVPVYSLGYAVVGYVVIEVNGTGKPVLAIVFKVGDVVHVVPLVESVVWYGPCTLHAPHHIRAVGDVLDFC